jgi:hypothetical protein
MLFKDYILNNSLEMPINIAVGLTQADGISAIRLKLITSIGMEKEV